MDKICVVLFALLLPIGLNAQTPKTPLDRYLETGKTIIIAKCLSVGPVNILLKADVDVDILHVVKGKETLRKITVLSQYRMEVGKTYLLRTENEARPDGLYFTAKSRDSVIEVSRHENIETLEKLSPRIVVLRTMNLRIDSLEHEIRILNYEMEDLKAARKEG